MIVCVCNSINENKLVETIKKYNIQHIEELQKKLSICNNCCTCQRYIENKIALLKK